MGGRRRVFATWVPLRKKRIELSGSPGSELLTITRKMPKGGAKSKVHKSFASHRGKLREAHIPLLLPQTVLFGLHVGSRKSIGCTN